MIKSASIADQKQQTEWQIHFTFLDERKHYLRNSELVFMCRIKEKIERGFPPNTKEQQTLLAYYKHVRRLTRLTFRERYELLMKKKAKI